MNNSAPTENLIVEKSEAFAIRIVNLYKYLCYSDEVREKEFVMSKQILRSGTSIGANIAEAQYGCTCKEFKVKLQIAIKEANETRYWLNLLHATGYLADNMYKSMFTDCSELLRILTAIINKTEQTLKV